MVFMNTMTTPTGVVDVVYRAYTLDAYMAKSPLILQDALDQVRHCACSNQRTRFMPY